MVFPARRLEFAVRGERQCPRRITELNRFDVAALDPVAFLTGIQDAVSIVYELNRIYFVAGKDL